MNQEKMLGKIKWFKPKKGYGYIIGNDEETYYFDAINCLDINYSYKEGDVVQFVPNFFPTDYATDVKLVVKNEVFYKE